MKKTEFLSASLPYGAKFLNKVTYEDAVMLLHGVVFNEVFSQYGEFPIKDAKPIIRPLDSLTKECVQANYNGGKPFVPIVELFNEVSGGYSAKTYDKGLQDFTDNVRYTSYKHLEFWIVQQLIKWHFDLISEDCDKIFVNNNFNPYIK